MIFFLNLILAALLASGTLACIGFLLWVFDEVWLGGELRKALRLKVNKWLS